MLQMMRRNLANVHVVPVASLRGVWNDLRKTAMGFVGMLLILTILCGCGRKSFKQSSTSMLPTIKKDEVVTADMSAYAKASPARWDVVIFTEPKTGQPWCARVVGLPGENLDIQTQGIFINGKNTPLPAHLTNVSYLPTIAGAPPGSVAFPFQVPAETYFVLGDNTTNSYDSRFWGPLPASNILGKVIGK